jgi:hypothetical protein
MLPSHLVAEFWESVARELRRKHHLSEIDAASALAKYRSALERHQADEVIYHREPESVAETVASGWQHAFPDPKVQAAG